jgi:hypothetical protein
LDLRVAVPSQAQPYHIAPDDLDAPHQITDAGGHVVWPWDHDLFDNGTGPRIGLYRAPWLEAHGDLACRMTMQESIMVRSVVLLAG